MRLVGLAEFLALTVLVAKTVFGNPCQPGRTGPDCTKCEAGKFKPVSGAQACSECDEGYWSAAGALSCSIPHWHQVTTSWGALSVSAQGGGAITVYGAGFRSKSFGAPHDQLMCEFSRGTQRASSSVSLACPADQGCETFECAAPFWPYSFGPAVFNLNFYSSTSSLPRDDASFDIGHGPCSSYFHNVNTGWCVDDGACEACARSCEVECAQTGASKSLQLQLHHTAWATGASKAPSIVCSGTCPCSNVSVTLTASEQKLFSNVNRSAGAQEAEGFFESATGSFSDGFEGNYSSLSNCTWLISAATDISLVFPKFDTETYYDYVLINTCDTSECSQPQQLARLSGAQAPNWTVYHSSTGYMQVVFESDDIVQSSGFSAVVTFGDFVMHRIGHNTSNVFEIRQCVERVALYEQTSGSAGGGSVLEIEGSGFDVSRSDYECRFAGEIGEIMVGPAVAETAQRLRCTTPPWGQNYSSGPVGITVLMNSSVVEQCAHASSLNFSFTTTWDPGASLLPVIQASELHSNSGIAITIRGYGFDQGKNYSCNISMGTPAHVALIGVARFVSVTELVCNKSADTQVCVS